MKARSKISTKINKLFCSVIFLFFSTGHCQEPKANQIEESRFPFYIDLPIPSSVKTSTKLNSTTFSDSFTDSQGRTLLYRYSLPEDYDPSKKQPVLIYFHGNNTGTQQEILDSFFPGINSRGQARGIIPVVVASPRTRNPPQENVRQWYAEDRLLIRELLQGNFEGNITIDSNQIYFLGGSQGTCFLHEFIMEYGENYGGGFFGGCGCYNSPDPLWNPSKEFKDRFKVLVHTTTEDFLYETSYKGYGYYKYTIGLNTRGDLDKAGNHCVDHFSKLDESLDWFTGVSNIAEEPFKPHWKRVSSMSAILGITVDSKRTAWLLQQSDINTVTLWKSVDQGENWQSINQITGVGKDIDAMGNNLFISLSDGLYRSSDNGANFQKIKSNTFPNNVIVDSSNRIYADGYPIQWSDDNGDSWTSIGANNNNLLLNYDMINTGSTPKFLATESVNEGPNYIGSIINNEWKLIADTPLGPAHYAALSQTNLWGLVSTFDDYGLYKSTNEGISWEEVTLPIQLSNVGFGFTKSTVLGAESMILHGGWNPSLLTNNAGTSWSRVLGLETVLEGRTGKNSSIDTYLFDRSDGKAAFRLVLLEDEDTIFKQGFESSE